jgi:hypothetical protein
MEFVVIIAVTDVEVRAVLFGLGQRIDMSGLALYIPVHMLEVLLVLLI